MDWLIIAKWTTDFTGREYEAPAIISTMIDMFLNGAAIPPGVRPGAVSTACGPGGALSVKVKVLWHAFPALSIRLRQSDGFKVLVAQVEVHRKDNQLVAPGRNREQLGQCLRISAGLLAAQARKPRRHDRADDAQQHDHDDQLHDREPMPPPGAGGTVTGWGL